MHQLEQVVREEWGRLVALLLAQFRRLDVVEDALGDAVEAAQRTWPRQGVPDNPAAWLLTAARRRMVDRLRSEDVAQRKAPLLAVDATHQQLRTQVMADDGSLVEDDVLRLVLMCAHPALSLDAASALSLRLVVGVSTAEIARLFLVPEPTMAARITRAKKRIVGAGIPFAVPDSSALPDRLDVVAQTAYLAFTAGYAPGAGPDLLRAELGGQAISLARITHAMVPDEPVLTALLALMLLQHARRDARVSNGRLVLLADQDRSRWHQKEIAEGMRLLDAAPLRAPMGLQAAAYTIQARIAAEHATATSPDQTRWDRIVGWYDALLELTPSPSVRLARSVAVAELHGPTAGLEALEGGELPATHRAAAVRAELLRRAGHVDAARAAFDQAIAACGNDVERAFLVEQRDDLDSNS